MLFRSNLPIGLRQLAMDDWRLISCVGPLLHHLMIILNMRAQLRGGRRGPSFLARAPPLRAPPAAKSLRILGVGVVLVASLRLRHARAICMLRGLTCTLLNDLRIILSSVTGR